MDFLLNRLPRTADDIFVDASDSQGIGGYLGQYYFAIPQWKIRSQNVHTDIIATKELLACVISLVCFEDQVSHRLVNLQTDNQNVYHQLQKGRSSNLIGTKLLALWEYGKYRTESKISPKWLPSKANRSADELSRGRTPRWLQNQGSKRKLTQKHIKILTTNPMQIWLDTLV